jgi:antitoxin MazE
MPLPRNLDQPPAHEQKVVDRRTKPRAAAVGAEKPLSTGDDLRDYIAGMEALMKVRLVRIGNSRGVRLPKPLIEEAGLGDEVELVVRDRAIVIASAYRRRSGWASADKRLRRRGEDRRVRKMTINRPDERLETPNEFVDRSRRDY